jgi:hypothetical protein
LYAITEEDIKPLVEPAEQFILTIEKLIATTGTDKNGVI